VGRHRADERTDTFRLLFVCTGNICRSPFAEILTRHLLRGRLGGRAAAAFDVSSAGVAAVVGSAMHPDSRAELPRGAWRARREPEFIPRHPSIQKEDHRDALYPHPVAAG
jgi:Low molecular weight phosphotyrosine protein phosphatase